MLIGNSFSILQARFSLIYKTFLYAVIVFLILAALVVSILSPILAPIYNEVKEVPIAGDIGRLVTDIVRGETESQQANYQTVAGDIELIGKAIGKHILNFNWSIVIIVLFVFFAIFVMNLCFYPVSDVLYNFMNSNSKFGFWANLLANLKNSLKYAAINIAVWLLQIGLMAAIGAFSWFVVGRISVIIVPWFFTLCCVLLYALKNAFANRWLPAMVVGKKKVFAALAESLRFGAKNFPKMFGLYFIVHLLFLAFNFMFTVFTFGVGLLIGFSIELVFLRALELVVYHRDNKLKYYTSVKDFNVSNDIAE